MMKRWVIRFLCPFENNCLNLLFWQIVALCCCACVWDANFIFGDDEFVVNSVCRDLFRRPGIVPSWGRFMPLQGLDVNFVLLFPKSLRTNIPLMLYSLLAFFFIVTCRCMIGLLKTATDGVVDRPAPNSLSVVQFLCFLSFLTAHSVLADFCLNLLPEGRIVFGLSVFFIMATLMTRSQSLFFPIGAILSAIYLSLFKENALVLPVGYSMIFLFFGWRKLSLNHRICFVSIVLFAIVFCFLYLILIKPHITVSYSTGRQIPLLNAAGYFTRNPLLFMALILAVVRAYYLLIKKSRAHLIWDAALFAAVAHVSSYVLLRYRADYYVTPAYVFVAPVICHWLIVAYKKLGSLFYCVSVGCMFVLIAMKTGETVKTYQKIYSSRISDVPTLKEFAHNNMVKKILYFYPQSGLFEDWLKHVFASFWRYAGGDERKLVVVQNCPEYIDYSDVLILPQAEKTSQSLLRQFKGLRSKTAKMSQYDVVLGQVDRRPSKFVGDDLKVEASDERSFDAFYPCEQWGRWGSPDATFTVRLGESVRGKDIYVNARIGGLVANRHPTAGVKIMIDGIKIHEVEWRRFGRFEERFIVPAAFTRDEELKICFVPSDGGVCPADVGIGNDKRKLGVSFEWLELSASPFWRKKSAGFSVPQAFNDCGGFVAETGRKFRYVGSKNEAYLRFSISDFDPTPYRLKMKIRARPQLLTKAYVRTATQTIPGAVVNGDMAEFVVDMSKIRSVIWTDKRVYVGVGFPKSALKDGDTIELVDFKFELAE